MFQPLQQRLNSAGSAFDLLRRPQIELSDWRAEETQLLQQQATQWVELARPEPPIAGHRGQQLDSRCVALSFFPAATYQGVVLYEPFGGLCAGLEMLLRNGVQVTRLSLQRYRSCSTQCSKLQDKIAQSEVHRSAAA